MGQTLKAGLSSADKWNEELEEKPWDGCPIISSDIAPQNVPCAHKLTDNESPDRVGSDHRGGGCGFVIRMAQNLRIDIDCAFLWRALSLISIQYLKFNGSWRRHSFGARSGLIAMAFILALASPSLTAQRLLPINAEEEVVASPSLPGDIETLYAQLRRGPLAQRSSAAWSLALMKGPHAFPAILRALRRSGDTRLHTQQILLALGASGSRLAPSYLRHIIRDSRFGRSTLGCSGSAISIDTRRTAVLALAARSLKLWDKTLTDCILDQAMPEILRVDAAAALCWQLVREASPPEDSRQTNSDLGDSLPASPFKPETVCLLEDVILTAGSDLKQWVTLSLYLTQNTTEPSLDVVQLHASLQFLKATGRVLAPHTERLAFQKISLRPRVRRVDLTAPSPSVLVELKAASSALALCRHQLVLPVFSTRLTDSIKISHLVVESDVDDHRINR